MMSSKKNSKPYSKGQGRSTQVIFKIAYILFCCQQGCKFTWPNGPHWICYFHCVQFIFVYIVSGDGELKNMSQFFKDHNMYLHIKTKFRHSNLVENSIRTIKRALYFILRRKKSKNWSKYLSSAVNTVNNNYNPAIGTINVLRNQYLDLFGPNQPTL